MGVGGGVAVVLIVRGLFGILQDLAVGFYAVNVLMHDVVAGVPDLSDPGLSAWSNCHSTYRIYRCFVSSGFGVVVGNPFRRVSTVGALVVLLLLDHAPRLGRLLDLSEGLAYSWILSLVSFARQEHIVGCLERLTFYDRLRKHISQLVAFAPNLSILLSINWL